MAFLHTRAASVYGAALFLIFTAGILSPLHASSQNARRQVRIGLYDTDTLNPAGGDNRITAFVKDYARAIGDYARWDCTFVPLSWEACLESEKNGTIDILFDVSKTEERLAYYCYSSESMGTEMCLLYGRSDTHLKYGDYKGFSGMTVGYETGSTIIEEFRAYAASRGFTFREVPYKSGAELFSALKAGKIDTVVQTNFYDTPEGFVILAKCSPSPVYIVTPKSSPELKAELDDAMARLFSYNPRFNADIYQYHFGTIASQTSEYTRQETAYLARHPVVNVYYETTWEPFEYSRGGTAAGITPDIIRAIGKDTGIEFRFMLTPSTLDVYDSVTKEENDTVMAVSYDYSWANAHDLLLTQPYITASVMRVTRKTGDPPKVAAVVAEGYLEHRVHAFYPELLEKPFLTFSECMEAVKSGQADCVFINYYQASIYRSDPRYEDFSYQPDRNITQNISLGVTTSSDPSLYGILSKSLQRISADTVQGILNENTVPVERFSIRVMIRRYPLQTLFIISLVFALFTFLIVLLVTAHVRRRQNILLEKAKKEAEQANNAKSEFLSRMSHDIRTPLHGIIGMTHIALQQQNSPRTADCLSKIDKSSRFLMGLVNDILDMSKMESGKIELHPEKYRITDFTGYVDAVIQPLCDGKNQKLEIHTSEVKGFAPLADILRLNQIFFNLFSNAVKYTPEGGTISCSLGETDAGEGRMMIHFSIQDSGIGMSESFQKILFTPFSQENRNNNSEIRGSGLGLAIVKKLTDAMGGTVTVRSSLNEGTLFTVEIPAVRVPDDGSASSSYTGTKQPSDYSILAGRHILVCEDHLLNQEIAQALLAEKGMIADIAENGQAGVEKFRRSQLRFYDTILMDIRMPVMDGYEAAESIRALDREDAKTVPIIAMTADAFTGDIEKCRAAGMNGHIAKPIATDELYILLASEISQASETKASRL
jgi:signal transduction histidine kinase/AmiR/NasT family two-component response regulator